MKYGSSVRILSVVLLILLAGCGGGETLTAAAPSSSQIEGEEQAQTTGGTLDPVTAVGDSATEADPTVTVISETTTKSADETAAPTPAPTQATSKDPTVATTPTTDSVCVTVPTTIPGQTFCDGYDPTPPTDPADKNCPDWATTVVTRPSGGWLGVDGASSKDGLWRSKLNDIGANDSLDAFAAQTAAAAPSGFSVSSKRASANAACIEESLILGVVLAGPAEERIGVSRMRLTGQVDWFQEGYPPTKRFTGATGNEFATFDSPTVIKVWMVTPDGEMTKASAYGENADRRSGWPTTTTNFGSTEPAVAVDHGPSTRCWP